MEPQIHHSGYSSYYPDHTRKRKKSALKLGCFGIVGGIFLIILIAAAGYFLVFPAMTPNKIRGNLLDVTIADDNKGGKIWVLTDGSFNYIKSEKRPGRTSMGKACIFCKTWLYIIDPVSGNVLDKHKTELDDVVLISDIEYANGKVWLFIKEYGENHARIESYDATSGKLISDTKDFIEEHEELSAGIAEINYDKKTKLLNIKTNDGRNLILEIGSGKLTSSGKSEDKQDSSITSFLVLVSDKDSRERKSLYIVTGPKYKLEKSSFDSYVHDPRTLKFFTGATAEKLKGNYLEGIIYYQDNDCAIIIHLDRLGKQSNRIMSCTDTRTGKERWRISQDILFEELIIDEIKDSFSSLFFTKDMIEVNRSSDLVLLHLKNVGLMVFDFRSGKKLKEFKI